MTSLIRRAGRVTLAVTTPGRRRLLFASRESAKKPVLAIRTVRPGGSAAPAPPAAPTAPGAPTHVVVTAATATSLTLTWSPAADISGYELFLDGRRAATTAGTTYVFNGLSCGTSYAVGVRAYRDANSHSDLATVTAATLPCAARDPVITAAGDIAASGGHQSATGALITQIAPTRALTLGDNAYPNGSASDYAGYYDPSWGQFKAKTSPTPGNHDYRTSGASGYFGYFGDRAPGPYYSFDLEPWHLISLNGEIDHSAASAQLTWLEHDLAAHPVDCVLAYWHGPRFSSGSEHGSDTSFDSFWQALYAAHAEVVLNGHEHEYERFAPQNPGGDADPNGLREFVVGTGGADLYDFGTPLANSQVRDNSTFGVLELTLHSDGYDWRFVPEPGNGFADSGSASCH